MMSRTEQEQQLTTAVKQQKTDENKKDYQKPSLTQLGKVEGLTQGGPGTLS